MFRLRTDPWRALAVMGGVAYPPLVYLGISTVSPVAITVLGLSLLALRLVAVRRSAEALPWMVAFLLAAIMLSGSLILAPDLAIRAYPVLVSLAVAGVFAVSLVFPPTVIERIARIHEPELPAAGVAYTRKVTGIWLIFLLGNTAVSAATGLWGTLEIWTLWNGLLSYVLMGGLFAGEFIYRKLARRRGDAPHPALRPADRR